MYDSKLVLIFWVENLNKFDFLTVEGDGDDAQLTFCVFCKCVNLFNSDTVLVSRKVESS